MDPYDAIVIGAGHNGLISGCYLARAGLKVVVLERTDRIGGACVTEELWPGVRMSTASYATSLLIPEVIHELGLDIDIRLKDPDFFHPYDDGGGLLFWDDPTKTHDAIAHLSKKDAEAYPRFHELFDEAARRLTPLLHYPATRKQARRAFRQSEIEGLFDKTVTGSIAEVAEEYFEHELMRGIHASQGLIGTGAGPRTPGTAYVYLHHAFGMATGRLGQWGFVRGGQGAITGALADVLRASGGEIRTEVEVERLKLDVRRRASGVVLDSGEEIDAGTVLSGVDPKRTLTFVPEDSVPPEFVVDIDIYPSEGMVVKVNCALSGLPKFRGIGSEGVAGPEHMGTISVAPSIDYLEASAREAVAGKVPAEMFCEAWIQTASEPELAPEGKHTLSVFAQYAPYTLAEGSWDERRDEIGDTVIANLERYAPGLTDLVEERVVFGPPDLEARFGLTGGNIFHGEILPDWIFEGRPASPWHRYRLPIAGFYLCGSGAHPGGGVCGAPGRNAARAVLVDLAARGVERAVEPGATTAVRT